MVVKYKNVGTILEKTNPKGTLLKEKVDTETEYEILIANANAQNS